MSISLCSPLLNLWDIRLCNSKSPEEEKDQAQIAQSAPEIRDVFGDSEDEEEDAYAVHNDIEQDSNVSIPCLKTFLLYMLIAWCSQSH